MKAAIGFLLLASAAAQLCTDVADYSIDNEIATVTSTHVQLRATSDGYFYIGEPDVIENGVSVRDAHETRFSFGSMRERLFAGVVNGALDFDCYTRNFDLTGDDIWQVGSATSCDIENTEVGSFGVMAAVSLKRVNVVGSATVTITAALVDSSVGGAGTCDPTCANDDTTCTTQCSPGLIPIVQVGGTDSFVQFSIHVEDYAFCGSETVPSAPCTPKCGSRTGSGATWQDGVSPNWDGAFLEFDWDIEGGNMDGYSTKGTKGWGPKSATWRSGKAGKASKGTKTGSGSAKGSGLSLGSISGLSSTSTGTSSTGKSSTGKSSTGKSSTGNGLADLIDLFDDYEMTWSACNSSLFGTDHGDICYAAGVGGSFLGAGYGMVNSNGAWVSGNFADLGGRGRFVLGNSACTFGLDGAVCDQNNAWTEGYWSGFLIFEAVNGGWSDYGPCTQLCKQDAGDADGSRTRTCDNPEPRFGGSDCSGSDTDSACGVELCSDLTDLLPVTLTFEVPFADWTDDMTTVALNAVAESLRRHPNEFTLPVVSETMGGSNGMTSYTYFSTFFLADDTTANLVGQLQEVNFGDSTLAGGFTAGSVGGSSIKAEESTSTGAIVGGAVGGAVLIGAVAALIIKSRKPTTTAKAAPKRGAAAVGMNEVSLNVDI